MRNDRLLILGGFLMGAMGATLFAGCSGSSGNNGAGGSGAGGSGKGGSGAGGSAMDAGTDHGSTGGSGAGGSNADAHADVATDKGTTDTGSVDMAVDTPVDAGGPCVTNFGAGNPVQFAFDGGANGGWTVFQTHYTGNPDPLFTRSLA